jgi:trimeric autotransporter adhesin
MKSRFFGILSGIFILGLMWGCGGGGGGSSDSGVVPGPVAPSVSLVSIDVSPVDPVIALGTTTQLKATGIYSDNTKKDLTTSVTWDSSDTAVATVDKGLARSFARGSSTIRAKSGSMSGSRTLTVTTATLQSIQVTPVNPDVALGTTRQFTATGIFSDDSVQDLTQQVTWSSSAGAVASLSNAAGSKGLATPSGVGSATVSATLDSVIGSTNITVTSATLVSIQVTPTNPSIPKGTAQQFAATGVYSDNSTQDLTAQAVWSSSNTSITNISNAVDSNGLASALTAGSAVISAGLGNVSGTTTLTVTAAALVYIEVSPTNPSIPKGTTQQFAATGIYSDNSTQDLTMQVVWSSSNTSITDISNAVDSNGLASALTAGSAVIGAALGSVSGNTTLEVTAATLTSIQVDPIDTAIPLEVSQQFTATGIYSDDSMQDLTQQVTWSSSAASVAAVSNAADSKGLATPAGTGSSTISATLDGVTGSTSLAVTSATLQSISLDPLNPKIAMGTSQQFAATGNYSDGSTYDLTNFVTWVSSNGSVASISNAADSRGLATPVSAGSATIQAVSGAIQSSTTLTVTNAALRSITITPSSPQIGLKTTFQFTAIGTFSDHSTQDLTNSVTWSSSVKTVATVSNGAKTKGLATAVGAGQTAVTAYFAGVSDSTTLTVFNASLVSITVTPAGQSIQNGKTLQFTATANYSNGLTQDITKMALWKSSNNHVAKVTNAKNRRGLAKGIGAGTSNITATMSSKLGSTALTVI